MTHPDLEALVAAAREALHPLRLYLLTPSQRAAWQAVPALAAELRLRREGASGAPGGTAP